MRKFSNFFAQVYQQYMEHLAKTDIPQVLSTVPLNNGVKTIRLNSKCGGPKNHTFFKFNRLH